MQPIFITGIGTGIGKTVTAAIVTEALQADYWKPVQAGFAEGTDTEWVKAHISNSISSVFAEAYKLKLAASPHIAAREEGIRIDPGFIREQAEMIKQRPQEQNRALIIEGAGGLLVPLNEKEFVADLIRVLHAKVILVSRNYLGSINHSLLTAEACRQYKLDVAGWIFNDQYMHYEEEIVKWSGFPALGAIPFSSNPDQQFIKEQADRLKDSLSKIV